MTSTDRGKFEKVQNMRSILIGFTHDNGFRVFSFDRLGDDRLRIRCTVRADLGLIRAYGIQVQELPLLCRGLLDRCEEGPEIQSLIFAEGDMRECANEQAAVAEAVAKKRRPWRLPAVEDVRVLPGSPKTPGSGPVFLPGRN